MLAVGSVVDNTARPPSKLNTILVMSRMALGCGEHPYLEVCPFTSLTTRKPSLTRGLRNHGAKLVFWTNVDAVSSEISAAQEMDWWSSPKQQCESTAERQIFGMPRWVETDG